MKLTLIRPPVVHHKNDIYGSIPGIPSSVAYLAAAIQQAGFDVNVLDAYGLEPHQFYIFRKNYRARGLTPQQIAQRIELSENQLIGISVHCTQEHAITISIIKAIKEINANVPIVIGGYHATFVPEAFLEAGADFVILGEGEERLKNLMSALEGKISLEEIDGLARAGKITERTEFIKDLDAYPFAATDLLPLENYWSLKYAHGPVPAPHGENRSRYMNIITSRGCPYKCNFCQAPLMSKGHWLAKSASKVLEEIRYHKEKYNLSDFHIQDENFALKRQRVIDICQGIIDQKIQITFCFPSGLKMETLDEELLTLLREAGCRYISLSPETGSERVLKLMQKTANLDLVPKLDRKAFQLKIRTCNFFVVGYPGETDQDRHKTSQFIRKLARIGVDEIIMPILTPYPQTAAMQEPILQGFKEYDELCFSPFWRQDYKKLNSYRKFTYLQFYLIRIFTHPLRVLLQILNVFQHKHETKTEMTAYRFFRDFLDKLRQPSKTIE